MTKSKGSSGTQSQDDGVFAPITAVEDTLAGYGELSSIMVEATGQGRRRRSRSARSPRSSTDGTGSCGGISVIDQSSIIEASSASESVFTTLLTWVAAISLRSAGSG